MKNICIISTDAGEGHRGAENAIKTILMGNKYNVVSYEIYKDIIKKHDLTNKLFGLSAPDVYNDFVLKKGNSGFTWLILAATALLTIFIKKRSITFSIRRFFQKQKFDLVISLVPFLNEVLIKGLEKVNKEIKLLTLVVDFDEPFKRIWFQDVNQLVAVNTDKAYEQALSFGISKKNVYMLSGAVISPAFYYCECYSDEILKIKSKLDKNRKTLLILFGGYSPNRIMDYALALENSSLPIQIIYVCGRNIELFNKLNLLPFCKPRLVYDFVENLIPLYSVSDLCIGKPGPGVITEAVHMKVPLLVEKNKNTLIHEKYNVQWILGNKFGQIFNDELELVRKVSEMISGNSLEIYKKNEHAINNQGIFEMGRIIDKLVA